MGRMKWRRHRPLFSAPLPPQVQKPRIKWRILPIFWLAFKRTSTVLGATILISSFIGVWVAGSLVEESAAPALPDRMVLYIPLEGDLQEKPRDTALDDALGIARPTLQELIDAIDRAATDPKVKGLVARLDGGSYALAHIQELRAAVKRFRASGKFTYAYASSYGEGGSDLGRYFLAGAFQHVWMQPVGVVSIAGINAEMPFAKGLLDKIGIQPQFFQRKEYKNAYESFTSSEMSEASRESLGALIGAMKSEIVAGIAADRKIEPAKVEKLIDKGLFIAQEAKEAKLIDRIDYSDVLSDEINKLVTGQAEPDEAIYVDIGDYVHTVRMARQQALMMGAVASRKPASVALVYAVGAIMPSAVGAQAAPGMMGEEIAAADEIAPAILDATEDNAIKVIVLRINSPGGSPVASETILRAIDKARAKGKKVVISMGPMAASGGYWIATHADRIFVLPSTVTGSIGVLGGKVNLGGLWDKADIQWDSIRWGKNAGLWSMNAPFSESESERFNAMLDDVYANFVSRVAKGRKMKPEAVEIVARGRVWSGADALKNGLADQQGGLGEALDYAATLAGAKNRSQVEILIMPHPKNAIEKLMELLGQEALGSGPGNVSNSVVSLLRPLLAYWSIAQRPDLYTTYQPLTHMLDH